VRGLIVRVLVIGGGLGWLVRSARLQREAVAAIRKAHGDALYDWQLNNGSYSPFGEPPWPRWLVHTLGVDYSGNVVRVAIPSASEHELIHIGHLGRLRVLDIDTQVTDAGLAHLTGLTNLRQLDLRGTHATDAGLAHLKRLTNLSKLDLRGTHVTDAGLAHLKRLTNLSKLDLRGSQVTYAGRKELEHALPKLEVTR
jgi:Leucine Rich Repeat (LRR) protein